MPLYGADERRDSRYMDDDEYRRMREGEDNEYEYHDDAADDEEEKETVIDISGWKKEQDDLRQEEASRTAQYDPLRKKLDQMLNMKRCIEEVRYEE